MATILSKWNPRTADPELLDLPESDDFTLDPWPATPGADIRIEPADAMAARAQAIYGYSDSIGETNSANTTTGFRFDVVTKILVSPDGCHHYG